ncbi:MAG TPA: YaiI/YqxD family protein [Bacteriovoracaceae bacterium]|nr:YaiI/YqxD family protein [Bacteriovoracaceae bacterium]
MTRPTIWIDADACPKVIKEVIYKVSLRTQLPVILVANSSMFIPPHPLIKLVVVKAGADVADNYIAEHVVEHDIVITADIPLAAQIVEKAATALNVRGEVYTEENVRERLSMRDFMKELRDNGGMETGGPETFGPKDRERFTNSLNRILSQPKYSKI